MCASGHKLTIFGELLWLTIIEKQIFMSITRTLVICHSKLSMTFSIFLPCFQSSQERYGVVKPHFWIILG